MKFYRNLGAIRFESDTGNFQIFSAMPQMIIFQSKGNSNTFAIETTAAFYKDYLHLNNFSYYQEEQKCSSLVISNCVMADITKMGTNQLCDILIHTVKIVQRLSHLLNEWVGDFTTQQLVKINGKPVFIYIPTTNCQDTSNRDAKVLTSILQLFPKLKNKDDVSHRLLMKKLSKCKNLSEISEQIMYFSSLYGIKKNNSNGVNLNCSMPIKQSKEKAKLKLSIFSIDNLARSRKLKNTFYSSKKDTFNVSESRRSSSAIHITLPGRSCHNRRIITSSSNTSSRGVRHISKQKSILIGSTVNLNNQSNSSQFPEKSLKKCKQKAIDNYICTQTPISSTDEQKLFKKLETKKLNKTKTEQIVQADKTVDKGTIKSHQKIIISQKNIPIQTVSSYSIQETEKQKKLNTKEDRFTPVKMPEKISIQLNQIRPEKIKTTKNQSIHKSQSIHIPYTAIQQKNQYSAIQMKKEKKLKKKKHQALQEEEISSEIEIINLSSKPRELIKQAIKNKDSNESKSIFKETTQNMKISKINLEKPSIRFEGMETRKNSWKQEDVKMEATVRMSNKIEDQLIERRKKLDYMGLAVVNTSNYLKNYQKIFWELPLFFIYRSFYFLREKLAKDMERLRGQKIYSELLQQNEQIKIAVSKLSKLIIKKIKKDDKLLKEIKPFLNVDEAVNCEEIMNDLLGEYIESVKQAVSSYPQLIDHQLEVVDAFLVSKAIKIENTREKLSTKKQKEAYLASQMIKFNQFV